MATGPARAKVGVSIAISRDPSLVRTVRLVAAAVARRASSNEELVEEVRLAVGEACAVMVAGTAGSQANGNADKVRLQMQIGERLRVAMSCVGDSVVPTLYTGAELDPWALLRGLADDLVVVHGDGKTSLSMSWPL